MRSLGRIVIWLLLPLLVSGAEPPTPAYGENPVTGAYAELNGIKLYCEQYGTGEPAVLVIHGNGASLAQMEFQITHFARTHRVIAADSRGHGKSGLGAGRVEIRRSLCSGLGRGRNGADVDGYLNAARRMSRTLRKAGADLSAMPPSTAMSPR